MPCVSVTQIGVDKRNDGKKNDDKKNDGKKNDDKKNDDKRNKLSIVRILIMASTFMNCSRSGVCGWVVMIDT